MERVVITLLARLGGCLPSTPIDFEDCGTACTVSTVSSRRRRSPPWYQITEILEFLRRLTVWSITRNVRIPRLLMIRSICFSLSGIEEGGGVISRCRIGRQKTYC